LVGRPNHLIVEDLPDVQRLTQDKMTCIRYYRAQIQALIVIQWYGSNWVGDGRIGDTKSPIVSIALDPRWLSL